MAVKSCCRVGDRVAPGPGGVILDGVTNVFINGIAAAEFHTRVSAHSHGLSHLDGTSLTVFINGLSIVREGDVAGCGHAADPASLNVFAS